MRPVYIDFRPVTIEAPEPSGPFTVKCPRCRWEGTVRRVVQAVRLREIHEGTYRHRHPDVTRPFSA